MRAGISFHRGPPASDVIYQHPIMKDPPSLLADSRPLDRILYSPLISEEPVYAASFRGRMIIVFPGGGVGVAGLRQPWPGFHEFKVPFE